MREIGEDEGVESSAVGLVVQDELDSFGGIVRPDTAVRGSGE